MQETRYQVWFLDTNGNRIHVFAGLGGGGDIRSIDCQVLLSEVGLHRIEFNLPAVQSEEFGDVTLGELVDTQVLVMRHDPLVDVGWTEVYRGFHRGLAYAMDEDGHETVASIGRHVNDLLASEPIRYPHGNTGACKEGPTESVAKRYVYQNIGAGALPAERVREGVGVEHDGATGARWEGCRGDRNLLEVVQELADAAPADFMMVPSGVASFCFTWREQWGLDRRRFNVSGNAPMVFAPRHGNCSRVEYLLDHQDEANVVYLLGRGTGSLRQVLTLRTERAHDRSKWARRAVSRDGRRAADDAELQAAGVAELVDKRPVETYTIDVLQSEGTRWGRDWDLGDLVEAEHRGRIVEQQIVGYRLTVDARGESLKAIGAELREGIEVTTTSTSTTTSTTTSTSTTTVSTTSTSHTTSNTYSMSLSLTKSDTTTTSTTTVSTSVTTVSFSMSMSRSYSTTTSTTTSTSLSTTTLAPFDGCV